MSRVNERDTVATAQLEKHHEQCDLLNATLISIEGRRPIQVALCSGPANRYLHVSLFT